MKKIFVISLLICSFILAGCGNTSTEKANPAHIKFQFGEQYEKKTVRMINVDGVLYYDSGVLSDLTPRCGTLDGELKKTVKKNEIPKKPQEANFDTHGYQNATSITKEVNIDGEWVIFKKFNTYNYALDDLRYCYYIKGHLNNAATDSEIIVLSENEDVTFNDVYGPLLSSQAVIGAGIGKTIHNPILNDKWGIYLSADNVTPSGMTLKIEQFGGKATGELQTGEWFKLETTVNDKWQEVNTNPLIDFAWHQTAYSIKRNDITELDVEWEWLYGKLPSGYYRLSKEITDFRKTKDYDKEIYDVYFTIE